MHFDFVSPKFCQIYDIAEEDFLRDPSLAFSVTHPDDHESLIEINKYATETGESFHWEGRYVINEKIVWIEVSSEPTFLPNGDTLWNGIIQDVSDRVNSEIELRYNEARLTESQEIAHLGSWDTNISTGETRWSKELYRLLGYEPYEVEACPENFYARVHKDDVDYLKHELERPFSEKNLVYRSEFRIVLPDNKIRIISERGKIIYDKHGEPWRYAGTSLDVTTFREQEEKLRQSQKMDALGKLTGGISHDYNNLLGIIRGYAELLHMQLSHEPELMEFANEILHATERGSDLANKLLSFSRHKTSNASLLNINTLLQEARHMLEKTLTASINLTFNLTKDLWLVELDSGDLEDTIVNISINAMHAMKDGGKLSFDTSNEQLNVAEAELLQLKPGEYILLCITDTGCGMNGATKEKIFDPFFTTKGDLGSGLGLSQVYGFVERSGGTIKVYSEQGHGSRFAFYFPRSYNSETHVQDTTSNVKQNLRGSETLLVVDDEQAMTKLAHEILSAQGYEVLTANDGEQALLILEKEAVDLVISDVIMPNMDGYQLAAKVQQSYPHIKLQMISGFTDDRHSNMDDSLLHKNMLHKPYSSNTLLTRVRNLLDEGKTITD